MSVCLYVTVFLFSDNPETTCSEILHHSVCGKSEGKVTPSPTITSNLEVGKKLKSLENLGT